MRIGIISPYDMSRPGGVQEVITNLARQFNIAGHLTTIIAPRPPQNHSWRHQGVRLLGRSRMLHRPLKTSAELSWTSRGEIDMVLERGRFDILSVHEPWVPFLPRQFIRRSRLPIVATFHATLPKGLLANSTRVLIRPYARAMWPQFQSMVAVSSVVAEQLSKFNTGQPRIIPNGIDPVPFRSLAIVRHPLCQPDKPTVLYLGRLETRKGTRFLLEALSRIERGQKVSVRLIVAGDGPLLESLSKKATHLGLSEIHFLGRVNNQEKIRLLRSSDLFCSPALYGESFGIVLLEAMAAGIPIVAGNNPGYQAVMKGSSEESLTDPRDVMVLADKIWSMLQDEKLRSSVIAWQNQQLPKYSYPKIARQYLEILESVGGRT